MHFRPLFCIQLVTMNYAPYISLFLALCHYLLLRLFFTVTVVVTTRPFVSFVFPFLSSFFLINSTSFCVFYSPSLRLSLPHRSFISRHHANFFLRFSIYPCQPSRQDQHRHQPDICCGPITARRQRLRHNTEASPRRQAGNTMASKQKFGKTRGVKKKGTFRYIYIRGVILLPCICIFTQGLV